MAAQGGPGYRAERPGDRKRQEQSECQLLSHLSQFFRTFLSHFSPTSRVMSRRLSHLSRVFSAQIFAVSGVPVANQRLFFKGQVSRILLSFLRSFRSLSTHVWQARFLLILRALSAPFLVDLTLRALPAHCFPLRRGARSKFPQSSLN